MDPTEEALANAPTIPPRVRPAPSRAWIPAALALLAVALVAFPVAKRLHALAAAEPDRTPPVLTLHGLEPDATVALPLRLRLEVADASFPLTIEWTIDGDVLRGTDPLERELKSLRGDHVLFVRVTDDAGNESELRRAFRVHAPSATDPDSAPPTLNLGWEEGATLGPGRLPVQAVGAEACDVWIDGRPAEAALLLSPETLAPGPHTVTVRARSVNGLSSDRRTFVFDPSR